LIEIGSKTPEKNSAQTDRQTDRHYENNGHLAVNHFTFTVSDRHHWLITTINYCAILLCSILWYYHYEAIKDTKAVLQLHNTISDGHVWCHI